MGIFHGEEGSAYFPPSSHNKGSQRDPKKTKKTLNFVQVCVIIEQGSYMLPYQKTTLIQHYDERERQTACSR